MSDRDPGVRKLAEEIVYGAPGNKMEEYINVTEARINRFQAERDAALQAQLHRALGEGAGLRGEIARLEAWRVSETKARIADVREPSHGALSVLEMLEVGLRAALDSAPLSERAGAVWQAVAELAEQVPREEIEVLPAIRERLLKVAAQVDRVVSRWDALRAELDQPAPSGAKE